ncbi:MAG: type II toxin-antitoxin system HicB family antitoxin [Dehalococcoidia bacterium]|nr:type II toxin-antitoxin system HicB family antitoxin [Dehalococcoidia bacterium]
MARFKVPVDIEELEEGGYLATCPVLNGCHAEGETIAEAIENIQEAARLVIEFRQEQGLELPKGVAPKYEDCRIVWVPPRCRSGGRPCPPGVGRGRPFQPLRPLTCSNLTGRLTRATEGGRNGAVGIQFAYC